MVGTNPYAFDPRPPEKIDPSKWVSDSKIRCPMCSYEKLEFMDTCNSSLTGAAMIMVRCKTCSHIFYVPEVVWRTR
jgi:hypothetical protein